MTQSLPDRIKIRSFCQCPSQAFANHSPEVVLETSFASYNIYEKR